MKRRNNFFWNNKIQIIFTLIVILIIVVILTFFLDKYKVTKVKVTGNEHYTEEQIKEMVMTGGLSNNSVYLSLKYKDKEISGIPFIESMSVEVLSPDSILITVYEKALAGCVEYLGNYMYFDRKGIVVESSTEMTKGIPHVTGLKYGYVVLYKELPVENDEIFQNILNITQLFDKYELAADRMHFDKKLNVTLYFEEVKVSLGSNESIDEKIMQISHILPELSGKKGELHMENFKSGTENITFELD